MVNPLLISCSLCGRVYDESDRRPCQGSCTHTICMACHNKSKMETDECPICKTPNAFVHTTIDFQSIGLLEFMRTKVTRDNFLDVPEGTELRFCVPCVRQHKILTKSAGPSWNLVHGEKSAERSFLKAKNFAICADCALEGKHKDHKTILLRSVNLGFKMKNLMARGALLEQKLEMETDFEGWQSIVGHFKSVSYRAKLRSHLKSNIEEIGSFQVSNVEWQDAMKDSRKIVKALSEKDERAMDRMVKFEEQNLQSFIEFATLATKIEVDSECARLIEKVLNVLKEILKEIQEIVNLDPISQKQIEEIDREVEAKMNSLKAQLKSTSLLPVNSDDDQYYHYMVILSEYKEVFIEMEKTEAEMNLKMGQLKNAKAGEELNKLQEARAFLESEQSRGTIGKVEFYRKFININTKIYVFARETVEKQLELDQYITKFREASYRKRLTDLMMMSYFPDTPKKTPIDQAYQELIQEFLETHGKDALRNLTL